MRHPPPIAGAASGRRSRSRIRAAALALAAIAAGSEAAAGETAPDPAPGATVDECSRPLTRGDFEVMDKVADDRLYLAELAPGAIACLVDRLVHTKDAKTVEAFRAFIQNDVWEAIRERLRAIEKAGAAPPPILERVSVLRETGYSDDAFFLGGYAHYQLENKRNQTTSGGATERYRVEVQSLRLSASADGVIDLGLWKIKPALSAFGDSLWSSERLEPGSGSGGATGAGDRSYLGAGGDGSVSVLTRDERVNLRAYGSLARYDDPPPRKVEREHSAGGAARLQRLWGSALGAQASADWYADELVPLGAGYFELRYEELFLHGEVSYMWKAAGLLATYDHQHYDNEPGIYKDHDTSDAGALVLHLPSNGDDFVRIAAGGGSWKKDFRMLHGAWSRSSGGELHAKASGDFRVAPVLRVDFAVTAWAKQARGTFEGWYPRGEAQVGTTLSVRDLRLRVAVDGGYERRDLNLDQEHFYVMPTAEASYAPVEFFNVTASGAWEIVRQYDTEAFRYAYREAAASVGLRVSRKLDVWLWTEGNVVDDLFEADDVASEVAVSTILERLSLRW